MINPESLSQFLGFLFIIIIVVVVETRSHYIAEAGFELCLPA
jgi:hypothetical protein